MISYFKSFCLSFYLSCFLAFLLSLLMHFLDTGRIKLAIRGELRCFDRPARRDEERVIYSSGTIFTLSAPTLKAVCAFGHFAVVHTHLHILLYSPWLTGAEMSPWIAVGFSLPNNSPVKLHPALLTRPVAWETYLFVCLFAWFKYLVGKILNFCPQVRVLIFS